MISYTQALRNSGYRQVVEAAKTLMQDTTDPDRTYFSLSEAAEYAGYPGGDKEMSHQHIRAMIEDDIGKILVPLSFKFFQRMKQVRGPRFVYHHPEEFLAVGGRRVAGYGYATGGNSLIAECLRRISIQHERVRGAKTNGLAREDKERIDASLLVIEKTTRPVISGPDS